MAAKSGFTLDDLTQMGPTEIERKRKIAEALIAAGGGIQDIRSPMQGFAQLANALVGNIKSARLDRAEREGKSGAQALWGAGLGLGEYPPAPPAPGGGGAGNASPQSSAVADGPKGTESYTGGKQDFIAMMMPYAIEASKRTGIDPRIIVAQAANESGWGRSAPGNNYFGIKGPGQSFNTHEEVDGKLVPMKDSFRVFKDPADSVAGYADFMIKNPRYGKMRSAQGLEAQLAELGRSGYATKSGYGNIIGQIARGIPMPAAGGPSPAATQVASLDPNSAMAAGLQAQGFAPDSEQAQAFARLQPGAGAGVTVDPSGVQIAETPEALDRLTLQQSLAGSPAGAVPAPGGIIPPPAAENAQADPPARLAQALIGDPAATLGAPAITPDGPGMGTLMNMAGNEFMTPQQQRMIEALTGRHLEQADPEHQLDLDMKRAQLGKLQRGDPADAVELDIKRAQLEKLRAPASPGYRQLSPDEVKAMGLDPKKAYQTALTGDDAGKISQIGGGDTNITVGGEVKLPTGYQWKDPNDPTQGVVPIPGGPATQLPSEAAGRLGLADTFLGNFDSIQSDIKSGKLTGLIDRFTSGNLSSSQGARPFQQIQSGVDSLRRMLTGAGMPQAEADEYAFRYLPTYTDDAKSLSGKMDRLKEELTSIQKRVEQGRGGNEPAPSDLPEGVTEDDIQHTMKLHGVTREQVLERLRAP